MLTDMYGIPQPTVEELDKGYRFSAEDIQKMKDLAYYRTWPPPSQSSFIAPLPPPKPAPKRKYPPVTELLAGIKPYLVATALDLKDRKLTAEFDDITAFGGLLVKANPDDPRVIAAARFAVCQYNYFRRNRTPETYVKLVRIIKVNAESLEPFKLHGSYYYLTLETENSLGNCGIHQAKVFSSDIGSTYLKLFRRQRNYDPNGSSSAAPSEDDWEAEDISETLKRQKMREMGKENDDPEPLRKRENSSAGGSCR